MKYSFYATLLFLAVIMPTPSAQALQRAGSTGATPAAELRVGLAGSEPFVVNESGSPGGVAVEIWQALAAEAGWRYRFSRFENVPAALDALSNGMVDLVVGPVSITAERVRNARFSQPYFTSNLSILSRTEDPTLWQRIAPFFSRSFYLAVTFFVAVLALVGTLIWIAERRVAEGGFALKPARGIANGIWFAIVTMSTVGYGDLAPKTFLGKMVTAMWIVISIITATSLVAGIASTLTLTGMQRHTISTAEQLRDVRVAIVPNSPAEAFVAAYGGNAVSVASLAEGFTLLGQRNVDAVVFDRPQLLYFLKGREGSSVGVSRGNYVRQNYGFAAPLASPLIPDINVRLLELQESGRVDRIVRSWLGDDGAE